MIVISTLPIFLTKYLITFSQNKLDLFSRFDNIEKITIFDTSINLVRLEKCFHLHLPIWGSQPSSEVFYRPKPTTTNLREVKWYYFLHKRWVAGLWYKCRYPDFKSSLLKLLWWKFHNCFRKLESKNIPGRRVFPESFVALFIYYLNS